MDFNIRIYYGNSKSIFKRLNFDSEESKNDNESLIKYENLL